MSAVASGARQGELLGLRWEDVDLSRGLIFIRRTLVDVGGRLELSESKSPGDVHPKIVQERLGHSSIMVTMDIDSHVLVGLQREAARALDSALARRDERVLPRDELRGKT